jgi:hypothetical protein
MTGTVISLLSSSCYNLSFILFSSKVIVVVFRPPSWDTSAFAEWSTISPLTMIGKGVDTESVASFIFSSIEGAIMASRLTRDNNHIAYTMQNIERLLQTYKAD